MAEVNEIAIKWWQLFEPIPGIVSERPNTILIEKEILPIIFIPGIMGSRLKNRAGQAVWNPDSKWFMFKKYGMFWVNAEEKKASIIGDRFDREALSPIFHDAAHNQRVNTHRDDRRRAERGWGGVSWRNYGQLLHQLQQMDFDQSWREPVRHCFDMPVHAFPYNWTQSNYDSGEQLAAYINEVIDHYQAMNRLCERVILVTHSMGGLVARAACKLHGAEDKVLGVIHAAQPTTGSPAAYWRMKAGFERPDDPPEGEGWSWLRNPLGALIESAKHKLHEIKGTATAWTLGTDGREVTAVMANMPGGLELLPNQYYRTNGGERAWLVMPETKANTTLQLPKENPYREIYGVEKGYFRLIDQNWLGGEGDNIDYMDVTAWGDCLAKLSVAEHFHALTSEYCHPRSYQFFAHGIATADSVSYSQIVNGAHDEMFVVHAFKLASQSLKVHFGNRGGFRRAINERLDELIGLPENYFAIVQIDPPANNPSDTIGTSGGDGTVPVSSSTFLKALDVADLGESDLSYLERTHDSVMGAGISIEIVSRGIENLCLACIRERVQL